MSFLKYKEELLFANKPTSWISGNSQLNIKGYNYKEQINISSAVNMQKEAS